MRRPTYFTLPFLVLAFLVLLPGWAFCRPDRYAPVLERLQGLRNTPFARLMRIGTSAEGRPIFAVLLTNPKNARSICSDRLRVLLLAGQHGNEASPVISMLGLSEELSRTQNSSQQSILNETLLVIVPVANPDGFSRFERCNHNGVDLNRNWSAVNQPETQAVSRLVAILRPHVIIDQHEWLDNQPFHLNGVEVAGFGQERHYELARLLADAAIRRGGPRGGLELSALRFRRTADHRLAHRHFAQQGTCAMLVETSPSWSPQARSKAYRNFTMALLTTLVSPPDRLLAENIRAIADASRTADSVIAALYASGPSPYLPASCCVALFLTLGYVVLRYAGWRRWEPPTNPWGQLMRGIRLRWVARPARITISDALKLNAPPRMRMAIIRVHRPRPSDRKTSNPAFPTTGGIPRGPRRMRDGTSAVIRRPTHKTRSLMPYGAYTSYDSRELYG